MGPSKRNSKGSLEKNDVVVDVRMCGVVLKLPRLKLGHQRALDGLVGGRGGRICVSLRVFVSVTVRIDLIAAWNYQDFIKLGCVWVE